MVAAADSAYYEGLNEKLLAAIPAAARNVLEFGCANGRLGEACKHRQPGLRWTGVDIRVGDAARKRLDEVVPMDLDAPDAARLRRDYDVVVFGDLLEHLRDPEAFLSFAHAVSAPSARLVCCVPNMAHASVIERMLAGDLCYDEAGLLDATHLRFLSPASTFKLLLDAGWLPHQQDSYAVGHAVEPFLHQLIAAAGHLGIPPSTAARNVLGYQLIIDCVKAPVLPAHATTVPFSVIVPVNNRRQFDLNIARSPGIAEVQAEVVVVEGARHAAEAFEHGRRRARHRWTVFCHQDVYFARGTGRALGSLFANIADADAPGVLIGFAGLGRTADGRAVPAGLVIDRIARFDHEASREAVSIDELAIALTTDSTHVIDPRLGWHLWATDLCLSVTGGRHARLARVPLFHNSYNDGQLPPAFHASAQALTEKHRDRRVIPTLCGTIGAAPA